MSKWRHLALTRLLFACVVLVVSTLHSGEAFASPLVPCEKPGVKGHVVCGTIDVFEDRVASSGRTIPLNIVVLKAMNRNAAPDPVVVLAGGPGQAATDFASRMSSLLNDVRQERDIVLVDQRGTGRSNGLQCNDLTSTEKLQILLAEEMPRAALERCRTDLEKRANLALYSTPIAMDDLDEVRERLGYATWNLFGISYGTRAAMVYLRRHPEHVRTMTLRAVHYGNMVFVARDGQRALDRLFEDCASDDACGSAYPEFEAEFNGLLQSLESAPPTIKVSAERGGKREKVPLSRNLFAGTVRTTLYTADGQSELPRIIHATHENDFRPIARAIEQNLAIFDSISLGMLLSVHCPETINQVPSDRIDTETAGTFMGGAFLREALDACTLWPRSDLPDDFLQPFDSNVPTLIISGEIDPVTPPSWGDELRSRFQNSGHIVLEGIAHDMPPRCALDAMARFIESANPEGLETCCEGKTHRPRFDSR